MWQAKNRALFAQCLDGLAADPYVRQMEPIQQHAQGVSCYDHCLFVSYLAFSLCRITGLDCRVAARGGMLHDLYLQNWAQTNVNRLRRLWLHPHMALANARRFDLSPKEENIIQSHMWPVGRTLPRSWESVMVNLADKTAATLEMLHLVRILGVQKNLELLKQT